MRSTVPIAASELEAIVVIALAVIVTGCIWFVPGYFMNEHDEQRRRTRKDRP